MVGAGGLTVKLAVVVVPSPEVMVRLTVPALAIREAGTAAVMNRPYLGGMTARASIYAFKVVMHVKTFTGFRRQTPQSLPVAMVSSISAYFFNTSVR